MNVALPEMAGRLIACYIDQPDLFEDAKCENLVFAKIFPTNVTSLSYQILKECHTKGIKIDLTLLSSQLSHKGITTKEVYFEVGTFMPAYLPPQMVGQYVDALFKDYLSQSLSKKLNKAKVEVDSDTDPMQVISEMKDYIISVESSVNNVNKDKSISEAFDIAMQRIKDLKDGVIEQYGYTWGIKKLDEKTGGIGPGITVLAGSKGGGKTTTVVNVLVHNAIYKNTPVKFFSLEMKPDDIVINMLSHIKEINSFAMRRGFVDDEQFTELSKAKSLFKENISIDDTGGITWQYFESSVRAWRKKNKVPLNQTMLIMLDYLQLMKNTPDEMRMSKEERIEQIMTELMRICKNENLSLLLLSQFSRDVDKRGEQAKKNAAEGTKYGRDGKMDIGALRPSMGDLKGSSAIEANAVMIILLFRPDYHGLEFDSKGNDLRGLCEMNIVKNRFGNPQAVYAEFEGKYSRLTDYDEPEENKEDVF
nr:DnaB-like helicase C-terminal domain-containing protein [uncultured Flavobacterium sp.]